MSEGRIIHVYDYVNLPYETVRERLTGDAAGVFRNATKVAAERARTIASELRVNIAGIEVSKEIAIKVNSVEDVPASGRTSQKTKISLEWEAADMPRLFPLMRAELFVYPLTSSETQLDLDGRYDPPLGVLGEVMDSVVGHRIAEASVHQFIRDVAGYLRS
jgi:hypothetical protein